MERLSILNGGTMKVKRSPLELVTPESETPSGFYFLSSLDQAIPFPVQTIYTFKTSSETVVDVLKQALAKVLVHYYPLAGAMTLDPEGRFIVELTRKGVIFVEAVADCSIDSIGDIRVPNDDTTRKLIYIDPTAKSFLELPLLAAQVTKFKCGGFSLGIAISHPMVDGVSGMNFVNSWAEMARGLAAPSVIPFHDRTLLKTRVPPVPKYPYDDFVQIADVSDMESLYQKEKNISRMFTFDAGKLAAIKKMAMADGRLQACSTFSALAALVWQARSKALNMKPAQLTKLRILVDLRSKFKEPLPKNYFGNVVTTTCCLATAGELAEQPISYTVEHIRKACDLVDEDYVWSRIDYIDIYRPPLASVATLVISSWTRLAYGSSNFGWGDPTQFGCGDLARELCVFQNEGEKGIAVMMALPVSCMSTFGKLIDQV